MSTETVTESPSVTVCLVRSEEDGGASFSMGEHTHSVPMRMHQGNRTKLLQHFKDSPKHSLILLEGGKSTIRDATDHEPVFRQESYFHYLFGVSEPDCFALIDVETGDCILAVPRLPQEYAVWMGAILPPEHFLKKYAVQRVIYVDEVQSFVENYSPERVFLLQGKNTDSGETHQPPALPYLQELAKKKENDELVDLQKLHRAVSECRVVKSQEELDLMRYVCRVSSEAHVKVMQTIKPGMYEYQMESLFRHLTYSEGGCRHMSYTCICGAGINSAVLHYGHAGAPNDIKIQDGDLCLFDMGAEYHCYGADITCSFPANGKFTEEQRDVYESVLRAQEEVFSRLKPGVNWVEMHKAAERGFLTVLRDRGYLVGDVEEMMEKRVGALLQPHGLGHLLGIDTHDVGGYPDGVERPKESGLKSLRTARNLEENMVLTVEPGVYFIDALLRPALEDPELSKFFNKERILSMLDRRFGGVRLEDDIVITKDGYENFTICPRKVEDVEAVMAGASWPPSSQ